MLDVVMWIIVGLCVIGFVVGVVGMVRCLRDPNSYDDDYDYGRDLR